MTTPLGPGIPRDTPAERADELALHLDEQVNSGDFIESGPDATARMDDLGEVATVVQPLIGSGGFNDADRRRDNAPPIWLSAAALLEPSL